MRFIHFLATIAIILLLISCGTSKDTTKSSIGDEYAQYRTTPAGVKYFDVKPGTGPEAVIGKKLTIDYIGTLQDGTVFDNTYDQKKPITITLGSESIIRGWNDGIIGMREGGKRKLVIPPEMGYGSRTVGSKIPANSTLYFELELIKVE